MNLKQEELFAWQKKNFPVDYLYNMEKDELVQIILLLQVTLGVCEEAGEVAHHVLKGTQRIREGNNGINKEEVADGVADGLIYGMQLMSLLKLKAEEEFPKVIEKILMRDWIKNSNGIGIDENDYEKITGIGTAKPPLGVIKPIFKTFCFNQPPVMPNPFLIKELNLKEGVARDVPYDATSGDFVNIPLDEIKGYFIDSCKKQLSNVYDDSIMDSLDDIDGSEHGGRFW